MENAEQKMKELQETVDTLMAANAAMTADIESLLELCGTIVSKNEEDQTAKAAFMELFRRKRHQKLQEILISIEDRSPSYAAKLQEIVDQSQRRIDGHNPN